LVVAWEQAFVVGQPVTADTFFTRYLESKFSDLKGNGRRVVLEPTLTRSVEALTDHELALSKLSRYHVVLGALQWTLENIDVHAPFETRPFWQQQEMGLRASPRMPCVVEPTAKLARYGVNLANAFQELRNRSEETWQRVVDRARLGVRHDVQGFRLPARRRGEVELEIVFGRDSDEPMPVEYLSEGQLSYLAMIALCELSDRSSILAFDEPEVHLHPQLLARVMLMLEDVSESVPVLLSTHSDRLLDCIVDPLTSVILCDLNADGVMQLLRPNKDALDRWLEGYTSIGRIIAEGYVDQLFDKPPPRRKLGAQS
jgi:predicted ATPase